MELKKDPDSPPAAGAEPRPAGGFRRRRPGEGQSAEEVESQYDAVAEEWAAAFRGEHDKKPKDREMLERFAREVGSRRPVWDLGCGPGDTAAHLESLGVESSGLDLSGKMLERARAIHPGISFRKGNILALDFANGTIAGVVAFYAIVHFSEGQVRTAFREVFRVLQPGGIFLFTYHVGEGAIHLEEFLGKKVDIDLVFFTDDFISRALRDCGFERIESVEREPYRGMEFESRRAYVFAFRSELKQTTT